MVLEILVNPKKVNGKPWEMFLIGMVYSLAGIALGYWMFQSQVSVVMVTLTTIATIPFLHGAITAEQEKTELLPHQNMFQKHWRMMSIFTFLFLGFVTAFVSSFIFLPSGIVSTIFQAQIGAITEVRNTITGNFTFFFSTFFTILGNNLKVLIFCIIFSLAYGAGAIFILSWNASVMGAAIGNAILTGINNNVNEPLQIISTNIAGYFIHGIPEMMAYFITALAGGTISIALLKHGFRSVKFKQAGMDSLNLIAFAVLTLVLAALVEVSISPTLLT